MMLATDSAVTAAATRSVHRILLTCQHFMGKYCIYWFPLYFDQKT